MVYNTQTFIDKSTHIHSNLYDYSMVEYKNTNTKVKIICNIHGIFIQSPEKHLIGQGCPQCRGNKISKTKRLTKQEFIERAMSIHQGNYDYQHVKYINAHTKVIIICKKHGEFQQTPNNHIYDKNGCPACRNNSVSNNSNKWLDSLHIDLVREYLIPNTNFKADGFDPETNTIYEYLGKFWHGCPDSYNPLDIHPKCKIPFKELYIKTMERLNKIQSLGYNIVFIWGD